MMHADTERLPGNLAAIGDDLRRALTARHTRRRRRTVTAGSVAVAGLLMTGAAAATGLLPVPTPAAVLARLAEVDTGMPPELRLLPDGQGARRAATHGRAELWVADTTRGGQCLVLTLAGRPMGVPCTDRGASDRPPIDVSLSHTAARVGAAPEVVVGGRVNAARATGLDLTLEDGRRIDIPIAADGYFVFDVPQGDRGAVHGHALAFTARAADGRAVAALRVPAAWDVEDPIGDDPLRDVRLRTADDDLRVVTALDGVVDPERVTRLDLVWPDGGTTDVPVTETGSFSVAIPTGRRLDLFTGTARLVAHGHDGGVVGRRTVAAPARRRAGG